MVFLKQINFRKIVNALLKIAIGLLVILGSSFLVIPNGIYSCLKFLILKVIRFIRNISKAIEGTFQKPTSISLVFPRISYKVSFPKFSLGKIWKISDIKRSVGARMFLFIPRDIFCFICGSLFTILFFVVPATLYSWYRELPRPELLSENIVRCTRILDRKLRPLYEICPEKRGEPVALTKIPQDMINATLAIEDSSFYRHGGFRPLSILRAAKEDLFGDSIQGGSTITQQLVKLSLLSPERTLSRKLKELILSMWTEQMYTKDQILEMYLNNAPYGGNVVGVEEASQKFFGKSADALGLAEFSMLAGLPTAPSVYSPFTSFGLAKERQQLVLSRMVKLSMISQKEADAAFSQELSFIPQTDFIKAPHFVDYVRLNLETIYGKHYVDFGGLTVVTTLDLDVYDKVQTIISEEVGNAKYLNISNGASIVLDAKSGEILAMVGSVDYFNSANDGVFNASTAKRQPGSTIKPVTYTLALMRGYRASTVIDDSPFSIKDGSGKAYSPVNYDGVYHGKVTLRQALANSYNIPAVKILKSLNIDDMVNLAHDMGLTSWVADGSYGLAITLGGKEANLLDLTNVFGTLARDGVYTNTKFLLSVKDSKGYDIYKYDVVKKRIVPSEVAYIITNILSDYYARLKAFGVNNFLSIKGHTVAVKTGTTDYKRDNYTVGYTPSFVVGVWVGNNNNSPMNQRLASGLTGAAPAWNKIMSFLLSDKPNEDFLVPDGIVIKVYPECGNVKEVYIKGTEPAKISCGTEKDDKDKNDKKSKKDKD